VQGSGKEVESVGGKAGVRGCHKEDVEQMLKLDEEAAP
jgi:hypothetical protein